MINWQEIQNLLCDPMLWVAILLILSSLHGLCAFVKNPTNPALGLPIIFFILVTIEIFFGLLMHMDNPDKPVKNIEHTCTVQPDKTRTEITEIKPEKISITITTTCR